MRALRPSTLAVSLGAASWVQLAVVPVAHAPRLGVGVVAAGLLPLGPLVAALRLAATRPAATVGLALGAYPLALGFFALVLGASTPPRFDAASRALPALSALAFAASVLAWAREGRPSVPSTLTPTEPAPRAPAPRLGATVFALLVALAALLSTALPAALGAREARTAAERLAGPEVDAGREALVTAGGLVLAVAVVLGAGGPLLRAPLARPRRALRGLVYAMWALVLALLRYWLDHAR